MPDICNISVITTGTGPSGWFGSRVPHQHSSFYAKGLWWLLWGDYSGGDTGPFDWYYSTSNGDGVWSSGTSLGTFPGWDANWLLVYDADNDWVHVAGGIGGDTANKGMRYRRGRPNANGTITWSTAFQSVFANTNWYGDPSLCVDTNGLVWTGYGNVTESLARKNTATDGTWSDGGPITVHNVSQGHSLLTPLSGGGVYSVSYEYGADNKATGYTVASDGTVTSEGQITGQIVEGSHSGAGGFTVPRIDSGGRNGVTHVAYTKQGGGEIRYRRRSAAGSWGTDTLLASGHSEFIISSPRIIFGEANQVAVIWTNGETEQWIAESHNDGLTWGAATSLQTGLTLDDHYEHMMPSLESNGEGTTLFTYLSSDFELTAAFIVWGPRSLTSVSFA